MIISSILLEPTEENYEGHKHKYLLSVSNFSLLMDLVKDNSLHKDPQVSEWSDEPSE